MCGIVGYIGPRNCVPIIMEGLKRLEYRGYDSAGIAVIQNGGITVEKRAGKVIDLVNRINSLNGTLSGHVGMGHTRWATHGEPNDINAHPHFDLNKEVSIIHNGIIENYQAIRTKLLRDGHTFVSDTDTEVLAHLIGELYKKTNNRVAAVRYALAEIEDQSAWILRNRWWTILCTR